MIEGMQIVREELARLIRGMVPMTLIAYGVFALCGHAGLDTVCSLLLGFAYAMLLFFLIGKSAVKATLYPPAQGTRIVRKGYMVRYLMTGVFVVAAIKLPFLNPLAAVLPLFFPKIILLMSSVFQRKGG